MDELDALIAAALEGGTTRIGAFDPVVHKPTRARFAAIRAKLARIREIAVDRWAHRATTGAAGGKSDEDFDAVFTEILGLCEDLSRVMDRVIAQDRTTIAWLNGSIIALYIVMFTWLALSVGRNQQTMQTRANELEDRVTERTAQLRRANEDLTAARDRAEEASRVKSEFLANVSHEIRTPMNAVIGMGSLLLRSPLSPEQRRSVEIMNSSGQALLAIINDVLDLSKIESGKMMLEAIDFDVVMLVGEAVEMFREAARAKGLDWRSTVRFDGPTVVRADPVRIRQVLLNLLSNALKFTERGSVQVTLARRTTTDGRSFLRCEIRDTGIGIAADVLPRLFESFSQADASTTRRFGGTGLGLAIARKLVGIMGGSITVESEIGVGSLFLFEVPIDVAHGAPVSLSASPSKDVARFATRPRLLVAEDNVVNQEVVSAMLGSLGFDAELVRNGAEAVEAASRNRYAAILMDCQMPVMDGFDATVKIRSGETDGRRTPIIALTAAGMPAEAERARKAGMDAFLLKPVTLEHLDATLREWIARTSTAMSDAIDDAAFERLRRTAGGDRETLDRLLKVFLDDTPKRVVELDRAALDGDIANVGAVAHRVKGAAAYVGATRLTALLQRLERDAQNGVVDGDVLRDARAEFARVVDALRGRMSGVA